MYEYNNENRKDSEFEGSGSQYRYSGPFYQDDLSSSYRSGSSSSGTFGEVPKKKKKGGFFRTVAKTVCIALVFGVVAGAAFQGTGYLGKQLLKKNITIEETVEPIPEIEAVPVPEEGQQPVLSGGISNVTAIVEQCMPSLVAITNVSVKEVESFWGFGWYNLPQQQEQTSSGTGIIIGQNETELLIVTNNHVIEGANTLTVLFSVDEGKEEAEAVTAKIKGADATKDIGVIAVELADIPGETLEEIKIATIGDSSRLQVGEQVVAIGNALGYGQSVTTGIVSALNREVALKNEDGTMIQNSLIQTDAAINPGNSGGALLNMRGEVVGINEAKLSSQYVEGVGYAIPITDVEELIGDLKSMTTRSVVAEEKMGYLGIGCQDVTKEASEMYDMPMGIYLRSVVKGCGAEQAGLKKGDILVKFDGVTVTNYDALRERIQYYEAGETVEVTIQSPKNGEYVEKTVTVTLSTKAAVEAASE